MARGDDRGRDPHAALPRPEAYAAAARERLGTGFFGFAALGTSVPDGDDACTFDALEPASGRSFLVGESDATGKKRDFRVYVDEDGRWEFEARPGMSYHLPLVPFDGVVQAEEGVVEQLHLVVIETC